MEQVKFPKYHSWQKSWLGETIPAIPLSLKRIQKKQIMTINTVYVDIPKSLSRKRKTIFTRFLKEREDMKNIHKENDLLITDELLIMKELLKHFKLACMFIIQNEYHQCFKVLSHVWVPRL